MTHRGLRDEPIDTLRLEISKQASRPPTASRFCPGIVERELSVVQEPGSAQAIEGTIHSGGGMLFLQQAPSQVEARVGAACQGAERGAVRRLEISQLLQPLE